LQNSTCGRLLLTPAQVFFFATGGPASCHFCHQSRLHSITAAARSLQSSPHLNFLDSRSVDSFLTQDLSFSARRGSKQVLD
jgi:hypothetical protein